MMQILTESVFKLEEQKISGLALIPRISRNNTLYTNNELARADGVTVPLNWEHDAETHCRYCHISSQSRDDTVILFCGNYRSRSSKSH